MQHRRLQHGPVQAQERYCGPSSRGLHSGRLRQVPRQHCGALRVCCLCLLMHLVRGPSVSLCLPGLKG